MILNTALNVNVLTDFLALVVICVIQFSERKEKTDLTYKKTFDWLTFLLSGVLLFDIPAWILDGRVFPGAHSICLILDTLYYLFQIIFCYFWALFSQSWCGIVDKRKVSSYLLLIPQLIEIVMIVINPWTGWIFTISENNIYTRGMYYHFNLLPFYFYILVAFIFAFIGYHRAESTEKRRQSIYLILYMFLPILGVILQSVYYGISLIWTFMTLCLLMIYMNVQQQMLNRQKIAVAEKEKEVAEGKMAIMLSQIQPHFLYNTLNSICALCSINPPRAEQAMIEFTEYLRGNIDSLTSEKMIPFEKEIEHTRHYLELEKMRFGERLNIIWDTEVKDFYMPTLSLQPLVENAVHYGVTKKEKGGTVTISSFETESTYKIIVKDDGVGFNTEIKKDKKKGKKKEEKERSHVGIYNVRSRIEDICNGTLEIESAVGKGTIVTIKIPKE